MPCENMFTFSILALCLCLCTKATLIKNQDGSDTNVAKENDLRSSLFHTLDGNLFAVDRENGDILWQIKGPAVVQVPKDMENTHDPPFLANPQDGSLYIVDRDKNLKKFAATIPTLVNNSPCRSYDGIWFTGKKQDSWISLNPKTGEKHNVLGFDADSATCPVPHPNSVFIGKAEYSLKMTDHKFNKIWNVSFCSYVAARNKDIENEYGLHHFTSSSTGLLVTMNVQKDIIWEANLGSPIVGAYISDPRGLISIPFQSLSNNTLHNLKQHNRNHMNFLPTLYIGEHSEGLYAISSGVDQNLVTISAKSEGKLLLTGPDGLAYLHEHLKTGHDLLTPKYDVRGYYHPPDVIGTNFEIAGPTIQPGRMITDASTNTKSVQTEPSLISRKSESVTVFLKSFSVVVVLIVSFSVYYRRRGKIGGETIGKISFNPKNIIGRGSNGTVVYSGKFESRKVAIKRLVPEFHHIAHKEVELLKLSDRHENVTRYFCMEKTRDFIYIALELCAGTLVAYVEFNEFKEDISGLEVLKQITRGLKHLHSLNIVHRDVKPQNILISHPRSDGRRRATVSDFGLCKMLRDGDISISHGKGFTGTAGWVAPEMLNENKSIPITTKVDIHPLGCMYYYVPTDGKHPFGDKDHRQLNILNHIVYFEMEEKTHLNATFKTLIKVMVAKEPDARPTCADILGHPIFFGNEKLLAFLQDASDKADQIAKKNSNHPVLIQLKEKQSTVIKGDWNEIIDVEIKSEISKHRGYNGISITDLLRSIRNKKHHYHELSDVVQQKLGDIPDGYTQYWLRHFPLLFIHTWITFQDFRDEKTFQPYYRSNFKYGKELIDYSEHHDPSYDVQRDITVEANPAVATPSRQKQKNPIWNIQNQTKDSLLNNPSPVRNWSASKQTDDRSYSNYKNGVSVNFSPKREVENVGLFRNFNNNLKPNTYKNKRKPKDDPD